MRRLPADDKVMVEQLVRAAVTIQGVVPPADRELFKSKLPAHYALDFDQPMKTSAFLKL